MPETDTVDAEQTRLVAALASADDRDPTCCYATRDKSWVQGSPHGEAWEICTVLEDAEVMGPERSEGPPCCA